MKQTSFALLASASLWFGQGSQPGPTQNRSNQHASASGEESTNPSSFVEPHYLLCPNPDVNDYRSVVNAEGTEVVFERNPVSHPNDVQLYVLDLLTGDGSAREVVSTKAGRQSLVDCRRAGEHNGTV